VSSSFWTRAALLLGFTACTDPGDRAAKQRIFSPEDPPAVVASAKEKLDPNELGNDPRLGHRVVTMGADEVAERLGAHKFTADVSFEWSSGSQRAKLTETRLLEAAAGGVGGDFHARIDNSRDQGLEVVRAHGQVFARSKYGKFRLRLRDRGIAERTRNDTAGALREVDSLFDGRLALVAKGPTTVEGRPAFRYEVRLAEADPHAASTASPPVAAATRSRMDDGTRRRQTFAEKRQPKALSGELVVDAASAVVLQAHVVGRLDVPGQSGAGPAELRLVLDERIRDVGRSPAIKPPDGFLPDADKPEGLADALDRFGIPRSGRADAGVDTEADDDPPG